MRRLVPWAAFNAFSLGMVGAVAWPLWSDNDLWSVLFVAVGIAVLFPLIFAGSSASSSRPFRPLRRIVA